MFERCVYSMLFLAIAGLAHTDAPVERIPPLPANSTPVIVQDFPLAAMPEPAVATVVAVADVVPTPTPTPAPVPPKPAPCPCVPVPPCGCDTPAKPAPCSCVPTCCRRRLFGGRR